MCSTSLPPVDISGAILSQRMLIAPVRPARRTRRQRAMRALRTMVTRQEARVYLGAFVFYAAFIGALGFWEGGAWVATMILCQVIAFHLLLVISFVLAYRREGRRNG